MADQDDKSNQTNQGHESSNDQSANEIILNKRDWNRIDETVQGNERNIPDVNPPVSDTVEPPDD